MSLSQQYIFCSPSSFCRVFCCIANISQCGPPESKYVPRLCRVWKEMHHLSDDRLTFLCYCLMEPFSLRHCGWLRMQLFYVLSTYWGFASWNVLFCRMCLFEFSQLKNAIQFNLNAKQNVYRLSHILWPFSNKPLPNVVWAYIWLCAVEVCLKSCD